MKKLCITFFWILMIFVSCSSDRNKEPVNVNKFSLENKPQENYKQSDIQENDEITNKEESGLIFIQPRDVKNYSGETVVVTGKVTDIHVSEKVSYLNFGEKFPKNDFSAVVFSGMYDEFGDLNRFDHRTVEIKGSVSLFRDKPQIILNSPEQIKILK